MLPGKSGAEGVAIAFFNRKVIHPSMKNGNINKITFSYTEFHREPQRATEICFLNSVFLCDLSVFSV